MLRWLILRSPSSKSLKAAICSCPSLRSEERNQVSTDTDVEEARIALIANLYDDGVFISETTETPLVMMSPEAPNAEKSLALYAKIPVPRRMAIFTVGANLWFKLLLWILRV